jgi:predicted MPP superfamily phosphohydrolase
VGSLLETSLSHDLEQRLKRRRQIEIQKDHHLTAHGHGDFFLRHERMVRALLRTALQVTGLYRRGVANALRPVVRHVRLAFPNLPAGLDGFRILHLSDLHIDAIDGLTEIVVQQVSALPVDLCVLTGDYRFEVYGTCEGVYPRMRSIVRAVRARHGILGILGNHDCADIAVELEKMGVRMLMNESVSVGPAGNRLSVLGIDDSYYYHCDDLVSAAEGVAAQDFKILLAHTPELFAEASAAGIHLYLSGHTHAGQIRLPWIGPLILHAECPEDFTGGFWRYGSMQGYTSAGVGCSLLPIRFGCPPEIVLIELAAR